jgi:hypothetical protein
MIPRRIIVLLASAAAVAAILGTPFVASAASTPASTPLSAPAAPAPPGTVEPRREINTSVDQDRGGVHSCPSNRCSIVRTPRGTRVTSYCYVRGQVLQGSPYWDRVTIRSGPHAGHSGWIHENWLADQSQNDRC